MEIRIICIGKIKNNHLKSLIDEYVDKIRNFIKINIVELNEITINDETKINISSILQKESELIYPYLDNSYNIALCIEAENYDSLKIAEKMQEIFNYHTNFKYLNFIIGSSYGIDDKIKKSCQLKWSLGRITLTHQLTRLILLEQVYRCFCINKNIKYHK